MHIISSEIGLKGPEVTIEMAVPSYSDLRLSIVLSFSSLCSLYTGQLAHFSMNFFQYSFLSGGKLLIISTQSISQHPFRSRNAGQGASDGCIHLHTQLSFSSQHIFIVHDSYYPHIKFSEYENRSPQLLGIVLLLVVGEPLLKD